MLNTIFSSILEEDINVDLKRMVFIILSAIALGLLISLLYLYNHKKETYVKSYIATMIMLPPIIALIILLVGDNIARAFSLTGAFSLVRYRSTPGDPSDICYLFFALATGLACGLGYIGYAFVFYLLLSILMIIITKTGFGEPSSSNMTLKITIPENLNFDSLFDDVLDEYTSNWKLNRVKTADFGSLFELVYTIDMRKDVEQKKFMDKLRTLNGNLNIVLVLSRNEEKLYA